MADVGIGVPVKVYNLYAWAGSEQDAKKREFTERLVTLIADDARGCPGQPFLILGDLNAEISSFGVLS
eukprot:12196471-Alexandrium_andersonii.AAC.1